MSGNIHYFHSEMLVKTTKYERDDMREIIMKIYSGLLFIDEFELLFIDRAEKNTGHRTKHNVPQKLS